MSAKQIIQDNRDKLLQILLYKEYQRYDELLYTHLNNETYNNKKLSFDEWLERILEDF